MSDPIEDGKQPNPDQFADPDPDIHILRRASDTAANYEEAFELTGCTFFLILENVPSCAAADQDFCYGLFNYAVLLSSAFILLHSIIESIGLAYVITGAECDLRLSVKQKGAINAGTFIGITLTAIPWGTLSDRFGRRSVMLPGIFVAAIISFASAMTNDFWTMLALRILVGCAVSASSATCLVYLGEMHTAERRDFAIASAIAFVAFAFIVVPAVAWPIIIGRWSFQIGALVVRPWRVFMWSWAIPGLIGAISLIFLPESPRFLLAAKGAAYALPILAKMYAINHNKTPEEFTLPFMKSSTAVLHKGKYNMWLDMKQLVKPPLLLCVGLSHFCLFIVYFLANGLYLWLPDFINIIMKRVEASSSMCTLIVEKYGKPVAVAIEDECQGPHPFIDDWMFPMSIIMESGIFCFFLLVLLTIEKYDKTKIYFCLMIPMAICLALSAIIPQAAVAGILLSLALAGGGAISLLTALAVEVFPTSLRALSMCTMYMAGQIGAAIGSNILSICLKPWSCPIVFIITALVTAGSAVSLVRFWPHYDDVRKEMEGRNFTY